MPNAIVLAKIANLANLANAGANGQEIAAKANEGMFDDLTEMERACISLATQHEENGMRGILAMTKLAILAERRKNRATEDRLSNLEGFATDLVTAMRGAKPKRRIIGNK